MLDNGLNTTISCAASFCIFSRCVTAQRSLLESGTMGTKGHTQVIVAHLTESYTSQVSISHTQVIVAHV